MKKALALWDRYWFEPSDRYEYGVFRILFLALYVVPHLLGAVDYLAQMASAPAALTAPTQLLRWLPLPLPCPASWVAPIHWLIVVASVGGLLGVFTRACLGTLAAIFLYSEAVFNSFGGIDHRTTLPAIVLALLTFAPGVTRFALEERWKGKSPARVPIWPARAILILICLTYFTAGYSKIRHSEGFWGDGNTLATYLTRKLGTEDNGPYLVAKRNLVPGTDWRDGVGLESFLYDAGYPTRLGKFVARRRFLIMALSLGTLAFELGFVSVLLLPRLLVFFLIGGVMLHVGVRFTMGIDFWSFMACYLLFPDYRAVERVLRARRKAAEGRSPIVFFDGSCGLCDRTVGFLVARDRCSSLRYAPLQGSTAREQLGAKLAGEMKSLALIDADGTHVKSDAVLRAVRALGGIWTFAALLAFVPKSLRDFVYDAVARNRYRLLGRLEVCRLPTRAERGLFLP